MSRIRSRNTRPEMIVRRLVHSLGYRFRLHRADLPGRPDLVFPRLRKIILVHGCFWHIHDCPRGRVVPRTRADFWKAKREANTARDASVTAALAALGWEVFIVWECWTRDPAALRTRVADFLTAPASRETPPPAL